jgi:CRISPR-associated exonuclease Cas4
MDDEFFIPVSALQHMLFCERQFALIHVEQMWRENQFTAEGRILHERVHQEGHESRRTIRQEYGYKIRSLKYGCIGVCDLVEIQIENKKPICVTPVEFKRGHSKTSNIDLVQLCAQALCLQEMFGMEVGYGQMYYFKEQRRKTIEFDDTLIALTVSLMQKCKDYIERRVTPRAIYDPAKCNTCSLFDLCGPKSFGSGGKNVRRYIAHLLEVMQTEMQS